ALGTDGARLPGVVLRDEVQVRLGHLDVEPENPVVADLERLDSGALPLRGLHRRDRRAASLRELRERVQLRAKTRADDTRITAGADFLDEGALEHFAQRRERAERRPQAAQQRRGARL